MTSGLSRLVLLASMGACFLAPTLSLAQTRSPDPREAASGEGAPSTTPASGRLTLQQAVARALSRNANVLVSQTDVMRAEALVKEAKSTYYPTLSANGTLTRLDADRVSNGNVISAQNQISANLLLTVPIIAPRSWAQARRAEDNADLARSGSDEVRRQVAMSVGRAYLTVMTQRRIIEVNERARDTAKAHLEFAQARRAGGVGTQLDEIRAAQELATAETQVQAAHAGLARAREALGVLVGDETAADAADDFDLGEVAAESGDVEDEIRSHRADIKLLEARVRAAERAVKDNWTDYSPTLTAVAQPFYQNPPTLMLPTWGWQAQLVLSVPLYDGGMRYGLADERKANVESARETLNGTLRQARADVRATQETVRRADLSLTAARDAARLASEALELASVAYRAGATTNIEVVDAERRARDAATTASIAEDTARQARLDHLISLGKFP